LLARLSCYDESHDATGSGSKHDQQPRSSSVAKQQPAPRRKFSINLRHTIGSIRDQGRPHHDGNLGQTGQKPQKKNPATA
jgi:hypothetical protein